MDRERKLRQQRECMQRLRLKRPKRLWPDEHIRALGPQMLLTCQMMEQYALLYGGRLESLPIPRGDW